MKYMNVFADSFRTAALFSSFIFALSNANADTLRYVGSSTVGKFISDSKAVYTDSGFKMNTKPESGGGERCPLKRSCDLGGVARAVNSALLAKGIHATLIGKDAIAAIVHPSNPVRDLSLAQLKSIFSGTITSWKAVGGKNLPIKVFIVAKNSATHKVFAKVVLGKAKYKAKVVKPDAKIINFVSRQKGAIGQISFAFIKGNNKVRAIKSDGQQASTANPNYPITRPLHLVSKGTPAGSTKAFINGALSTEGQKVVQNRFVGVK